MKDEDSKKLFEKIKLETVEKYKMESIENRVLKKKNLFERHRKVLDKFSDFEFKYYSKLLILYRNEDVYKNFEFKKFLELNKMKQNEDLSLFSIIKTFLNNDPLEKLKIFFSFKNKSGEKNRL